MITVSIIIPTCKQDHEISFLIGSLDWFAYKQHSTIPDIDHVVIPTCLPASAAVNRNHGLNLATGDIIVMCDDDIKITQDSWLYPLIEPLLKDPLISYVSARLLNNDGSFQNAMGSAGVSTSDPWPVVEMAPSACVAFRKDDLRFDENYVGSGFEDTDFCRQLKIKYPKSKFIINNNCKMIHLNEMKNQLGENYHLNRAYYNLKWGANE